MATHAIYVNIKGISTISTHSCKYHFGISLGPPQLSPQLECTQFHNMGQIKIKIICLSTSVIAAHGHQVFLAGIKHNGRVRVPSDVKCYLLSMLKKYCTLNRHG